ncbi:protein of unknown function [Cupriavidus taiwanensis]|uniref:Uncharacterized protein n=1 Tax=Cupriavidus taiwanensis TaxID=164546 RepID=A0A7Z7NMQ4_9BURK|nr:protein of unknown function [Cupriavidus taiwanensis]SOZ06147.1 hypothetical protein CBM2595_A80832 [Cupriavidus taiwanensis]SOZ08129.1 hypothetical protein CBM2597_A90735 [Cupriavidus taiwanensis]SPC18676.1 hypothetical protein CBM2594_A80115 [Cupriavidus taiwanensis]SPD40953.1 protein of unknown function [Cupriavidus taiwanensis]
MASLKRRGRGRPLFCCRLAALFPDSPPRVRLPADTRRGHQRSAPPHDADACRRPADHLADRTDGVQPRGLQCQPRGGVAVRDFPQGLHRHAGRADVAVRGAADAAGDSRRQAHRPDRPAQADDGGLADGGGRDAAAGAVARTGRAVPVVRADRGRLHAGPGRDAAPDRAGLDRCHPAAQLHLACAGAVGVRHARAGGDGLRDRACGLPPRVRGAGGSGAGGPGRPAMGASASARARRQRRAHRHRGRQPPLDAGPAAAPRTARGLRRQRGAVGRMGPARVPDPDPGLAHRAVAVVDRLGAGRVRHCHLCHPRGDAGGVAPAVGMEDHPRRPAGGRAGLPGLPLRRALLADVRTGLRAGPGAGQRAAQCHEHPAHRVAARPRRRGAGPALGGAEHQPGGLAADLRRGRHGAGHAADFPVDGGGDGSGGLLFAAPGTQGAGAAGQLSHGRLTRTGGKTDTACRRANAAPDAFAILESAGPAAPPPGAPRFQTDSLMIAT